MGRDTNPFLGGEPEKVWVMVRINPNLDFGGPSISTFTTEARFRKAIEKYGENVRSITEITCTYKELKTDGTS